MNEESIELWFKGGRSDKVYSVSLLNTSGNNWSVRFAYGRRGSAPQIGYKVTDVSYTKAKDVYDELVAEKEQRGYKSTSTTVNTMVTVGATANKSIGWIPQLLNPIEETDIQFYLDSDGWCMQEKFDGRNRLLLKEGKKAVGGNRKGLEVDITAEIKKELLSLPDCVLAGEDLGSHIACFDIISMKAGYLQRVKHLNQMIDKLNYIKYVYTAYERKDKIKFLARLRKENAEGVVFKQLDAHYTPGRPASGGSQVKFKFYATASVIAGDVNVGKRSVKMLMSRPHATEIRQEVIEVGNVTIYPNQEIPKKGTILEVKYLYAYPEGSLFQPVYLGPRDDLDVTECTIGQLKYKREEE
jgi:bifunctional non-homologous end joining protein LigD